MSKIIDHLYLGSYDDIKNKFHDNIEAKLIVNVTKECKYDSNVKQIVLEYADNPNADILKNIQNILDIIHQHVVNNENVFVHCYMGKSRSVTIILAYLITHQNYNLRDAYYHVKSIRKINPNIGFIRKLISYEVNLKSVSTLDQNESAICYITELLELDENFVRKMYESNNLDVDKTIDAIFKG